MRSYEVIFQIKSEKILFDIPQLVNLHFKEKQCQFQVLQNLHFTVSVLNVVHTIINHNSK